MKLSFSDRKIGETVEEDEGSLVLQKWMHIAVTAEWINSSSSTRVSLYTNTELKKNRVLNEYAIDDAADYDHYIGVDKDSSGNLVDFFEGFIYKLCFY